MQVQVSTDNNINGSAKLIENIAAELQETLSRFGNQITRIDVHLRDNERPQIRRRRQELPARGPARRPAADGREPRSAPRCDRRSTARPSKLERALDHLVGKLSDRKGRPSFGNGDGELED